MLLCRQSACQSTADEGLQSTSVTTASTSDVTTCTASLYSTCTCTAGHSTVTVRGPTVSLSTLPVHSERIRVNKQNSINRRANTSKQDLVNGDPVNAGDPVCSDPVTNDTVRRGGKVSGVSYSVMPNTQRNSSEFTFSHSSASHRRSRPDTVPHHHTAAAAACDTCQTSTSADVNLQKTNRDSLPVFSVNIDMRQSSLSREDDRRHVPAAATDFSTSLMHSWINTATSHVDKNSSSVCDSQADMTSSTSTVYTTRTSSSVGHLEQVLGKDRVQRLMQNLQHIDSVTTSTHAEDDDDNLCLSDSAKCADKVGSTTYETRRTCDEGTRTSGVDVGRPSYDGQEASVRGVHDVLRSSQRTSKDVRGRTDDDGDVEVDEDELKTTSSLALQLRGVSVSRVTSSDAVVEQQKNTSPAQCWSDAAAAQVNMTNSSAGWSTGHMHDTQRHMQSSHDADSVNNGSVTSLRHSSAHDEIPRQCDTAADGDDNDDDDDDDDELNESGSSVQQHIDGIRSMLRHG